MPDRNSSDLPIALVLGAAVWPDETPSPTLRRRAEHAATLYRDGHVGHIIGCGGLGQHPPSEARMIRKLCMENGVPAEYISDEDQSTTTRENLRNAIPILRRLGAGACPDVVVVTDLYHAPRARMAARQLGLKARSSSPSLKGAHPVRLAKSILREIPALVLYALKGR